MLIVSIILVTTKRISVTATTYFNLLLYNEFMNGASLEGASRIHTQAANAYRMLTFNKMTSI